MQKLKHYFQRANQEMSFMSTYMIQNYFPPFDHNSCLTVKGMQYSETGVIQESTQSRSRNEINTHTEYLVQKHNDLLSLKRSNLVPNKEKRKQGNKKEKQNHYTVLIMTMEMTRRLNCVVPENIHTPPPPRKGSEFSRGGVNLPNFPVRRGEDHHREIFPEGSRDA